MTDIDTTHDTAPDETDERPVMADVLDSLTGYDEIAITEAFGRYFAVLMDDPTMLARSMVFTVLRRGGAKDKDAKRAAMDLRWGDVQSFFADDDEQGELDPDNPDTPAGEDDSQPA